MNQSIITQQLLQLQLQQQEMQQQSSNSLTMQFQQQLHSLDNVVPVGLSPICVPLPLYNTNGLRQPNTFVNLDTGSPFRQSIFVTCLPWQCHLCRAAASPCGTVT